MSFNFDAKKYINPNIIFFLIIIGKINFKMFIKLFLIKIMEFLNYFFLFIQTTNIKTANFWMPRSEKKCLPFRRNAKLDFSYLNKKINKNKMKKCNSAEIKLSKRESKDLNERAREVRWKWESLKLFIILFSFSAHFLQL